MLVRIRKLDLLFFFLNGNSWKVFNEDGGVFRFMLQSTSLDAVLIRSRKSHWRLTW